MNKLFKEVIGNMGSNFTEQSSSTVARALSSLAVVAETFSKETGIRPDSTGHSTRSNVDDVVRVFNVVHNNSILKVQEGRFHSCFKHMSIDPLTSLDWEKMGEWMKRKVKEKTKFRRLRGEGNTSDTDDSDGEVSEN